MNSRILRQICRYSYPSPYSSPLIGLRFFGVDDFTQERPETQNWSLKQFWTNYIHTFTRWKKRNSTNSWISHRASRLWLLLDYHISNAIHLLSKMWSDCQPTAKPDSIQRRETIVLCKYCDNPIYFDDNVVSKNGKKIPLQEWDQQPHSCPNNPYNQFKKPSKIDDDLVISAAKSYVEFMNKKLVSYSLDLIVSGKEVF
jgi:hypothetical protein